MPTHAEVDAPAYERTDGVGWDDYLAEWDARDRADVSPQERHRAANIPPEYRGRTWDYGTTEGIVHCPFPPYKFDPQEPITQEFSDYQRYHGEQTARLHPEQRCRVHHRYLSKWEYEAIGPDMNGCSWCHPDLAEAHARLAPAAPRTRTTGQQSGKQGAMEVYADV